MGSTVFKIQRWFIIKIKIRNCKKWVSNIKCKQNTNSILVFFPFLPSVWELQPTGVTYHNPHTVTDILFWWHDDTRLAFTRRHHRPHNSYPLIVHTTQPVMADLYQSTRKTTLRKKYFYTSKNISQCGPKLFPMSPACLVVSITGLSAGVKKRSLSRRPPVMAPVQIIWNNTNHYWRGWR